jgi:hypothetical protein
MLAPKKEGFLFLGMYCYFYASLVSPPYTPNASPPYVLNVLLCFLLFALAVVT